MNNSPFQVEVDGVTPEQWSQALDEFADANIYQTWAYGEVRWGRKALSHLVLKRGAEIVAMAQLRLTPPWALRCGIAYLRWGPLCQAKQKELEPDVVHAMAAALHEEYVRKRGRFLRLLPNAFKGTPRGEVFAAAFRQFSREPFAQGQTYRTLVLDLQPPLEEVRKQLDQKWRNQLNRAEKNNLTIVEGLGPESFGTFIRLYDEMMARKKFDTSTDIHEFARIQQTLPERHRLKTLICEDQGKPVSGVVVTALGDSGIYLFGATTDEGMKSKGAYLLQWAIVKWLRENGIRYYNLGGINPETNPGVYHFKSGLSGQDVLYAEACTACANGLSRMVMQAGVFARGGWRKFVKRGA